MTFNDIFKKFRFTIVSIAIIVVASSVAYFNDSFKENSPTSDQDNTLMNEQDEENEITENTSTTIQEVLTPDDLLYVVDKENSIPADYEPNDLVSVSQAGFSGNYLVREIIIEDLSKMREDAQAAGIILSIVSAYRSYLTQVETFNYWVNLEKQNGLSQTDAEAKANTYSARPGHSEHQLGTTIDFNEINDNFGNTPAGLWLANNAYKYGFKMSYPEGKEDETGYKYEPWHFRYVGFENV